MIVFVNYYIMKCPLCSIDLQMTYKNEVEIDYCPKCRGVWLDRGELEKLSASQVQNQKNFQSNYEDYEDDDRNLNQRQNNPNRKKSRFDFLGDLLDIG